ncbi:MAG: hypothetical protein U0744_04555 [Gemmataceae bacterium]
MAATMLSHTVYFTLHDASEARRIGWFEIARKYLANHPGVLFFGGQALQRTQSAR